MSSNQNVFINNLNAITYISSKLQYDKTDIF